MLCYGVLIIKKENKVGMRDGKFGWGAYVNRVVRKILGEKMKDVIPFKKKKNPVATSMFNGAYHQHHP